MLLGIDGNILLWIQDNLRNDFMTRFWKFITSLGNLGTIWIIISLVLIFIPKTKKIGVMSGIALILSLIFINIILKNMVASPRPFTEIENLVCLVSKPREYSFPSGHASSSFASAVIFLKKLKKRYSIPLFLLAVMIAFSRLYIGVHYPTDVLCGAIFGTLIGFLAMWIYDKIDKKFVDKSTKSEEKVEA